MKSRFVHSVNIKKMCFCHYQQYHCFDITNYIVDDFVNIFNPEQLWLIFLNAELYLGFF